MQAVRPKKALGQHFLTDQGIAQAIVAALRRYGPVLEVGPGTGVLTQYLLKDPSIQLKVVEIDTESVRYLLEHYPKLAPNLYEADFLKMDLTRLFATAGDRPDEQPDDRSGVQSVDGHPRATNEGSCDRFRERTNDSPGEGLRDVTNDSLRDGTFALIGNFPYNISSQIFFKVLDAREQIPEVVCMIQKEVAERLAAGPGTKTYGILSVLLQAWYDIEYLFTVGEGSFVPPPKVKSAVIRLTRSARQDLGCDEALFKKVVKTSFNQRRKTIRNSLKPLIAALPRVPAYIPYLDARPEQLSVEEFVELTQSLQA